MVLKPTVLPSEAVALIEEAVKILGECEGAHTVCVCIIVSRLVPVGVVAPGPVADGTQLMKRQLPIHPHF